MARLNPKRRKQLPDFRREQLGSGFRLASSGCVLSRQLLVRAALDDLPLVHQENLIGMTDGFLLCRHLDGFHQLSFILRVHTGGRPVICHGENCADDRLCRLKPFYRAVQEEYGHISDRISKNHKTGIRSPRGTVTDARLYHICPETVRLPDLFCILALNNRPNLRCDLFAPCRGSR